MQPSEKELHIESEEARSGRTPHIVRWVLGISLALAIIAMTAVWVVPAIG